MAFVSAVHLRHRLTSVSDSSASVPRPFSVANIAQGAQSHHYQIMLTLNEVWAVNLTYNLRTVQGPLPIFYVPGPHQSIQSHPFTGAELHSSGHRS